MTLVLLISAIVILVLTKKFVQPLIGGKKWGAPIVWFIVGSCAIIAGWAFFLTGLGKWAASAIGVVIGWVGAAAGWAFGTSAPPVRTISALILLALFLIVVVDIARDRKPDGPAIAAWALMPAFLILAPGSVFGSLLIPLYQQWQENGVSVLGWLGAA